MNKIGSIVLASTLLISGAAAAAEWQVVDEAGMEVHIYKPDSDPVVNEKRALMISLHGCTADKETNGAQWMQDFGNWQPTADKYGMVVALPAVPDGGAYGYNCWDWQPTDHARNNYYNKYVLKLVDALKVNEDLNIDPDQVYITGFSSGAGQALILGCLAPDIFAGMGLSCSAPLGTNDISNYDAELIKSTCLDYAGENISYFDEQVASIIIGSNDGQVPTSTQETIAAAMADIYQANNEVDSLSFPPEWGSAWEDGEYERVVFTEVPEMTHAWAAGGGEGDDWHDITHINYPAHVTEWFFNNNKRTGYCEDECEITDKVTAASEVDGTTVKIFGYVRGQNEDMDCGVDTDCLEIATIQLLDTETDTTKTYTTEIYGTSFELEISDLEAGDYEATVIAPDGTRQKTGVIRIDNNKGFDFMAWLRELIANWSWGGSWF